MMSKVYVKDNKEEVGGELQSWRGMRRILGVRGDAMGDVLMTTPALRALKAGGVEVTLLTSRAGARVARLVPEVDEVLEYNLPWVVANEPGEQGTLEELIEEIKSRRFDGAVIFTVYSQNPLPAALMTLMAKIPRRLGYSHHNPYQLLTDWVPDPEPQVVTRHEVQRQLELVKQVGFETDDLKLSLKYGEGLREKMREVLKEDGVDEGQPYVVVHPGVTEERRQYPLEKMAKAARGLQEKLGVKVVVTGSNKERRVAERVVSRIKGGNGLLMAGETTVEELVALIDGARMLVSNNSGPVHVAAAVGTPVVDVYALTNPQHTPWQVPHRVLFFETECKACLRGICAENHGEERLVVEPEEVVEAGMELWEEIVSNQAK